MKRFRKKITPRGYYRNPKIRGKDKDTRGQKFDSSIIESVTRILAATAGVASLIYVVGFIIVNIRLFSFGIRAFNFARATYISAGISFIMIYTIFFYAGELFGSRILAMLSGPLTRLENRIWNISKKDVKFVMRLSRIMEIFIVTLVILTLLMTTTLILVQPHQGLFLIAFMPESIVWILGHLFADFGNFFTLIFMFGSGIFMGLELIGPKKYKVVMVISLSLIILWGWSLNIYPQISANYGGGKPVKVQLVILDRQKRLLFSQMGIDLTRNVTAPVNLVDDTGENLIITFENRKGESYFAELDKSLIANILYLPLENQVFDPTSGNLVDTPNITPTLNITSTLTPIQP